MMITTLASKLRMSSWSWSSRKVQDNVHWPAHCVGDSGWKEFQSGVTEPAIFEGAFSPLSCANLCQGIWFQIRQRFLPEWGEVKLTFPHSSHFVKLLRSEKLLSNDLRWGLPRYSYTGCRSSSWGYSFQRDPLKLLAHPNLLALLVKHSECGHILSKCDTS